MWLVTSTRFPPALMHTAATLYYLEDVNQVEIAARLGVSRATVSRLLAEARRLGLVRIEVITPTDADHDELSSRLRDALGLDAVHLSRLPTRPPVGVALAPALSDALRAVELTAGDVLLVSSGRTIYEAAQAELPPLPGVLLAPTVGGQDEPEAWYATNEITRQVAAKVGGTPTFLYAPALPGAGLHATFLEDPSVARVVQLWHTARCAIVGVGAPPLMRTSLPRFVPNDSGALREAAGDICARFYDRDGRPVDWPGSDRLIATPFDVLGRVEACIAVAAGAMKVPSVLAGARAGYFNQLVTDAETATALLEALPHGYPSRAPRPASAP